MANPTNTTMREMLVKSMKSGTSTIAAKLTKDKKIPDPRNISAYFQQKSITRANLESVYGTSDEFFKSYSDFQKEYFKALDTQLHVEKAKQVNIAMLKRQGKIDLSILNKDAADRLEEMYKTKVLKIDKLMREVGLPSIQLPSANLYRGAFKFEVDQSEHMVHPVQAILNRTIFNFNPNKNGLQSLNLGRSNIFSLSNLERIYRQGQNFGPNQIFGPKPSTGKSMKILTFDVETTGVFAGADVRQMAIAEMVMDESGSISRATPLKDFTIGFKSAQMGGLTVRTKNQGVKSIFDFISQTEMDGKPLLDMGEGGERFLDEATKFINRLADADRVAGHNVMFDIDAMIATMMRQSAFGKHTGAQKAVERLQGRISEDNFLIDTLESTRSYLQGQVQDLVDSGEYLDLDARSKAFVDNLFAEETLARVHIGGSASYASVENIALNTNLFELIEKDGQAELLFEKISKGSHIADTDTILQSYIGKYIHEGSLKIIGALSDEERKQIGNFGRYARARILQSSALTATTNVADVQHLSDTVFNAILNNQSLTKQVQVRASAQALNIQSSQEGILRFFSGADEISKVQGITDAGYYFVTKADQAQKVEESVATREIQRILQSARTGTAGKTLVEMVNDDALRIIDTGWNIGQLSAVNEMDYIGDLKIASIGTPTPQLTQEISDVFTQMYKTMGSGGVYATGLNSYTLDMAKGIAQQLANIGDPFAFTDMGSRTVSASIAEATASIAEAANAAAIRSGITGGGIGITANPRLTANLGTSIFYSGKTARLFTEVGDEVATASKAIVPMKILQSALGEDYVMKNIGLSVSEFNNRRTVNVVWNANRQINKTQAQQLAEKLFDTMSDANEVAKIMGVDKVNLDKSVTNTINNIGTLKFKGTKEQAVNKLADLIMDRGIVIGSAGDQSESVIKALVQRGIVTSNDVMMGDLSASVAKTNLDDDFLTLSMFVDRKVASISPSGEKALTAAEELVEVNGKKISKYILNQDQIAQVIGADRGEARKLVGQFKRAAQGKEANAMLDFYNKYKPNIGYGLAAVAALSTGYYISKKHRERQLYDETLKEQPKEQVKTIDNYNQYSTFRGSLNSVRRDPLATAGVVGNLDRRSINHTSMSKDRYNHLYGG